MCDVPVRGHTADPSQGEAAQGLALSLHTSPCSPLGPGPGLPHIGRGCPLGRTTPVTWDTPGTTGRLRAVIHRDSPGTEPPPAPTLAVHRDWLLQDPTKQRQCSPRHHPGADIGSEFAEEWQRMNAVNFSVGQPPSTVYDFTHTTTTTSASIYLQTLKRACTFRGMQKITLSGEKVTTPGEKSSLGWYGRRPKR